MTTVALFKKNPFKKLDTTIVTNRILWEMVDRLPEPQRSRGLQTAPQGIRADYLAAKSVDPIAADAAIAAARAHPPRSEPSDCSWNELLDAATLD